MADTDDGDDHSRRKSTTRAHRSTETRRDAYEVKPGDSLWTIAESVLKTKDPRRIARYWPRLHRANRELIGADPNLLQPGWLLRLPPESRRP